MDIKFASCPRDVDAVENAAADVSRVGCDSDIPRLRPRFVGVLIGSSDLFRFPLTSLGFKLRKMSLARCFLLAEAGVQGPEASAVSGCTGVVGSVGS